MVTASLVVPFSLTGDGTDFIMLEQEPMDPSAGYLSIAQVYGYVKYLALGEGEPPAKTCLEDGEDYLDKVYAYPSRPGLVYRLGISAGSCSFPVIEIVEYAEEVQCDLEFEPDLKYPVRSITNYVWIGDTYDREGTVVPHPIVSINAEGNGIILPEKVYGTLTVVYDVERHTRSFSVTKREATENNYQSFAWAVWEGGNAAIELKVPEAVEFGKCNSGLEGGDDNLKIKFDDDKEGYVDPVNDYFSVDMCTGKATKK